MIDLPGQVEAIEKLMKLVEKYCIDELHVDYICIKKSLHEKKPKVLLPEEILEKHTTGLSVAEIKAQAEMKVEQIDSWLEGKV